jgi:hypothetical protein
LFLFDEELSDGTGLELAEFACSLTDKQSAPFILIKRPDNFELLVRTIMDLLAG